MPVVRPDYSRGWQGLAPLKPDSANWNRRQQPRLHVSDRSEVPKTAMPLAARLAAAAMGIFSVRAGCRGQSAACTALEILLAAEDREPVDDGRRVTK